MEDRGNVVKLLNKKKRGLLQKVLFSRLGLIVLLIVLQIFLFLSFFTWFRQYLRHYEILRAIFSIAMVLYLFNSSMDSSAKLTWMMIISIVPFIGTAFLFYSRTNLGQNVLHDKVQEMIRRTRRLLPQKETVLQELERDPYGTEDLHRYLNREGCFPVYDGTEVTFFPLGEDKFKAMLEELEKAEDYIFMEYFIIEEGLMWGRILDVLARKAKEGVDVRVMYDGMCEITTLSYDYADRLAKLGIKAKAFSPVRAFVSTHYNYRDHRKILSIDGKVAFTGGVNLADEYINEKERFGHWKDTAVMLKGDAAASLTLSFLQMWNVTETHPDFGPCEKLAEEQKETWAAGEGAKTEGYVMPYADSPLDSDKVGETVYMDLFDRATDYVHVMTPYLILDDEMETAIKYAAQRGVDVKLILPGIPDKEMAWALAKSHYRRLVNAGVKIYEYTPGFVHAKVAVSDDCRAVVGTINLDYRSLYHHFECAAYLYKVPCIPQIEEDFQETLAKCREVTQESITNEKTFMKFKGYVMKLVAPLM